MLDEFRRVEAAAAAGGVGFAEAMRMLAGTAGPDAQSQQDTARDWSAVTAGPWLAETLAGLRNPGELADVTPGSELKTVLRPYQQVGLRWLHLLVRLRLGACLADDMGLGKTIQVLALLLVLRRQERGKRRPSVLVAPASLLANWAAEIERHAPGLVRALVMGSRLYKVEVKIQALPKDRWDALCGRCSGAGASQ